MPRWMDFPRSRTPPGWRCCETATACCARGDASIVRVLLDAGASLDVRRWSGDTPLLAAVHGGDAGVVRLLLERGADVNEAESRMGQTPVMRAIADGNEGITRLLL